MNTPWILLDLWPLLWWVRCHSGLVENKSALYSLKQTSISVSETSCWVWFIRLTSNKWLWFITTAAWCQIMKTSMYFCRLFEDELLSSADVKQSDLSVRGSGWVCAPLERADGCFWQEVLRSERAPAGRDKPTASPSSERETEEKSMRIHDLESWAGADLQYRGCHGRQMREATSTHKVFIYKNKVYNS